MKVLHSKVILGLSSFQKCASFFFFFVFLLLSDTALSSDLTLWLGLSQHSDTSKNTKAWAVTTHWHQQEHQGLGCHNTLTPARAPRRGLSQHIDTSKSIKAWAVTTHWHQQEHQGVVCHNTLTPAWAPRRGLSQPIDTSKNTKAWAVSQCIWHQHEDPGLGCVTTH